MKILWTSCVVRNYRIKSILYNLKGLAPWKAFNPQTCCRRKFVVAFALAPVLVHHRPFDILGLQTDRVLLLTNQTVFAKKKKGGQATSRTWQVNKWAFERIQNWVQIQHPSCGRDVHASWSHVQQRGRSAERAWDMKAKQLTDWYDLKSQVFWSLGTGRANRQQRRTLDVVVRQGLQILNHLIRVFSSNTLARPCKANDNMFSSYYFY